MILQLYPHCSTLTFPFVEEVVTVCIYLSGGPPIECNALLKKYTRQTLSLTIAVLRMIMVTSLASSAADTASLPAWTKQPSAATCHPTVCWLWAGLGSREAASQAAASAASPSPVTTSPMPLPPPRGHTVEVSQGMDGILSPASFFFSLFIILLSV